MPLPAPLAALEQYPQFVAVRLVPDPSRPGKTNKLPINARTLGPASSTDPATWSTYAEASAIGMPVGFVLTDADPFWCLDIDGQLEHPLLDVFPGAAVEISSSGTGLHIWGCGTPPAHKCKNTALGIELYHTKRFMCLGDPASARGQIWQDFTQHLAAIVPTWFPAGDSVGAVAEWTSEPREDWRGSTDDAELIRRARESRSAGAIFGGKATFDDLWTCNDAVLSAAYPSMTDDAFGRSEADRALAQHLAFWTGCDCDRIERLMRQSALVRDKWDREDYLPRTILSAVSVCRDVCQDKAKPIEEAKPAVLDMAPIEVGHIAPVPEIRAEAVFCNMSQYAEMFRGCVYVSRQHRAYVPGAGDLVTPDSFRVLYGGVLFAKDPAATDWETDAWKAFTVSPNFRPPMAVGTTFRPDLPPGSLVNIQGDLYVNSYLPAGVACQEGDPGPFLQHMERLVPDAGDREKLLSYMAAVVQYPGKKFAWAPLIQGAPGNGKTLLSLVLREAVGHRYTSCPTKRQLEKEFNSWMDGKIFVMIEDVMVRRDLLEELKPMITGEVAPIERKGVDAESREVCCNFMFNCNPKDGIPKTADDRRIAPFYTAQQTPADIIRDGMTGSYFPNLYGWLKERGGYGIVTNFLRHYPIPDEYNPATSCVRAPMTSSTMEAIGRGMGSVEQDILEAIEEGRPGFRGDFVSSHFLDLLLRNNKHPIPLTKRRDVMLSIGYIPHPTLAGGRVNNIVLPDAVKPRIYVKMGSAAQYIATPVAVAEAYTAAQIMIDATQ